MRQTSLIVFLELNFLTSTSSFPNPHSVLLNHTLLPYYFPLFTHFLIKLSIECTPCSAGLVVLSSSPLFLPLFFRQYFFLQLSLFLSLPRSFLTSEDKDNMFTLDHFPVWYRRAAENPVGQFLYYMPRKETRGTGLTFTSAHTHIHTRRQAHKTIL